MKMDICIMTEIHESLVILLRRIVLIVRRFVKPNKLQEFCFLVDRKNASQHTPCSCSLTSTDKTTGSSASFDRLIFSCLSLW